MARKRGLPSNFSLTERLNQGNIDAKQDAEKTEAKKKSLQQRGIPGGAEFDDDGELTQAVNTSVFSQVTVAQIKNSPDNPANYGQGPAASTRLCSHKFILDQPMFDLYNLKMGYILVRFHKNGRKGPDWVYGPVSVGIYEQFAASNSKGAFINTTLNGYGYKPAGDTPYADQFAGFPANSGTDSAGIRL